jgi:hypothetical protein
LGDGGRGAHARVPSARTGPLSGKLPHRGRPLAYQVSAPYPHVRRHAGGQCFGPDRRHGFLSSDVGVEGMTDARCSLSSG